MGTREITHIFHKSRKNFEFFYHNMINVYIITEFITISRYH